MADKSKSAAMFPFTDKAFNPFSRENPFIALMPGMEPLHKVTETLMEGVAETSGAPADGFKSMTPDYNAFGANAETMMRAIPGFDNWPNLAAHPMGAAAASSAMAMGMASQMMGVMVGTMTGMMGSAARVGEAAKSADLPSASTFMASSPVKFEWAFTAEPTPKAKPKTKAAPKARAKKADVIDLVAEKAPAKAETATKQTATTKAKPAVKAKSTSARVTKTKAEPGKTAPAAKPKAAAAKTAAVKSTNAERGAAKKTATKKPAATKTVAGKAPTSKTPSAETVALKKVANAPAIDDVPARPGAGVALMRKDFKQPKKAAKPAKPDDLKQISGVGPKLEEVLNKLGIWQYDQIAKFSANEVAWLDDYLQFKGRIDRDDWIGQAASLAERTS